MLPEAKNQDLLYVAMNTESNDQVNVYSYPKVTLVGTLIGFQGAAGMCPDKNGNVWITDDSANTIVEYAHGGTQPIAALIVPKTFSPGGCSIDPTTGNLAAVGGPSGNQNGRGRILVYTGAGGKPQTYKVPYLETVFCTYDDEGDLFVTGFGYGENPPFALSELQNSANKFRAISFGSSGPPSYYPTPVQWDGRYVAVGSPVGVVQYTIRGFAAVKKGTTTFDDLHQLDNAWIQGGKIVLLNRGGEGTFPPVQIDKYPAGGYPIKTINSRTPAALFGVTVSLAPR